MEDDPALEIEGKCGGSEVWTDGQNKSAFLACVVVHVAYEYSVLVNLMFSLIS